MKIYKSFRRALCFLLLLSLIHICLCEVGVKADPAAVGVLIVHRGEVGDADDERALLLDVIEIGAGGRLFFPAAHQHGGDEGERKRGSGCGPDARHRCV